MRFRMSEETKQDAKRFNREYTLFELSYYSGAKSQYFHKYGHVYNAASKAICEDKQNVEIIGWRFNRETNQMEGRQLCAC